MDKLFKTRCITVHMQGDAEQSTAKDCALAMVENINTVPLNEASKHLDNILKARKPLTSTVRIDQMIRMLKNPTIELVEFVLEKLPLAIKSDLWWLSNDEQVLLSGSLCNLIKSAVIQIATDFEYLK